MAARIFSPFTNTQSQSGIFGSLWASNSPKVDPDGVVLQLVSAFWSKKTSRLSIMDSRSIVSMWRPKNKWIRIHFRPFGLFMPLAFESWHPAVRENLNTMGMIDLVRIFLPFYHLTNEKTLVWQRRAFDWKTIVNIYLRLCIWSVALLSYFGKHLLILSAKHSCH